LISYKMVQRRFVNEFFRIRQYSNFHVRRLSTSSSTSSLKPDLIDPVFYQFQPPYNLCPFCSRVRTTLEYHNIPHSNVLVNPFTKSELKVIRKEAFGSDVKKVQLPIVKIDDKWEMGSSQIVRSLIKRKYNKDLSDEEVNWMTWVDDNLVKFVVPITYGDPKASRRVFEMASRRAGLPFYIVWTNKYIAGFIMNKIATKLKGKYGMMNPKAEFVEKLSIFLNDLGESEFLGKDKPNGADLDVYSLLSTMIDANDQYRDEILINERLRNWYTRMKSHVK